MIASLRGALASRDESGTVVVEAGGVGYRLFVSSHTLSNLPEPGETVFLHAVTVVREDAFHLYGFALREEMELFNLLVQVRGIGPKLALSVLSGLRAREVRNAIARGDAALLSSIPGIGRKTAERILLELKDKVGPALPTAEPGASIDAALSADAVSALVNLGYRPGEAKEAVRTALEGRATVPTVDVLIRDSLKALSKGKAPR